MLKALILKVLCQSHSDNNNQMQTQKTIDKTIISKENKDAISITSRQRKMCASKQFDV